MPENSKYVLPDQHVICRHRRKREGSIHCWKRKKLERRKRESKEGKERK
jgi:hypothetical protein